GAGRRRVWPGVGVAVGEGPASVLVEGAGLETRTDLGRRARPARPAVARHRHHFEVLFAVARRGGDAEDVGVALAVGADGAAIDRIALRVVGRGADRVLAPRVAAVMRDAHAQAGRCGIALLLAYE